MRFSSVRGIFAAITAGACLTLAVQADARGVIIDTSGAWQQITKCGLAAGCTPITMAFSISTGGALTNQAYVYSNGVVSFGKPLSDASIAALTDPFTPTTDIAGLGADNVAAAILSSKVRGAAISENDAFGFVLEMASPDASPFSGTGFSISELSITPTGKPGAFTLTFREGYQGDGYPDLDPNATIGYSIGGGSNNNIFVANGGQVGRSVSQEVTVGPFDLLPPGAAPEPSIWAMMLVGVGGVGAMLRRRRRALA